MLPQSLIVRCLSHKSTEIRKAIHLQTFGEINPPKNERLGQEMHLMESVRIRNRSMPLVYLPLEYDSIEKPVICGESGNIPPTEAEQFLIGKARATLLFHRLTTPETLMSLPTALEELLKFQLSNEEHWFALVGFQLDTDPAKKTTNRTIEQVQRKLSELVGLRRDLIQEFQIKLRTRTTQPWRNRGQLDPVIESLIETIMSE
jgi:hypothetical protein